MKSFYAFYCLVTFFDGIEFPCLPISMYKCFTVPSKVRVARWLSPKYRTLAVLVYLAQNVEPFKHALSSITIIFIPDKDQKYLTIRLNTGHLATLKSSVMLDI